MQESYFRNNDEFYFMMHSEMKNNRPTIIFIHGLGDSGINYYPFSDQEALTGFNILIPDVLGYGRSSAAKNYNFQHQTEGLISHLQFLEKQYEVILSDIILVTHSMGGIYATLLCSSSLQQRIKGFISVEGSVTPYGAFVSEAAEKAVKENNFPEWFAQFKETIYKLGRDSVSLRRYHASLSFCRTEAFQQNAVELRKLSKALPGKFSHAMGKKYAELTQSRIYCYGDAMSQETLDFLQEHQLEMQYFSCPNHFVMTDCLKVFVPFLKQYIQRVLVT